MKGVVAALVAIGVSGAVFSGAQAEGCAKEASTYVVAKAAEKDDGGKAVEKKAVESKKKACAKSSGGDTLKIIGRVIEIPGTFPPNDLYNYVYVMKYRVMKVLNGSYDEKEILVGHYNPLIPRRKIKDKMDKYVEGDVEKFEEGNKHELVLVNPIDKVWKEALEDEYFDIDMSEKHYAVRADVVK
jgi:hypothetical protein